MGHNYQTDSLSSLDLVAFSETESELQEENEELRAEVARLREALEAVEWVEGAYAGSMTGYKYFGEQCPWCGQRSAHGHRSDCLREAALSTTDDCLAQHDAEVREQAMAEACATLRIAQMQHDAEVRQEEREQCAAFLEDFAKHYPENVFIPPPPGEHGKTVDACSAAAIRAILPILAAAIRESTT